jgi:hypothetical protein
MLEALLMPSHEQEDVWEKRTLSVRSSDSVQQKSERRGGFSAGGDVFETATRSGSCDSPRPPELAAVGASAKHGHHQRRHSDYVPTSCVATAAEKPRRSSVAHGGTSAAHGTDKHISRHSLKAPSSSFNRNPERTLHRSPERARSNSMSVITSNGTSSNAALLASVRGKAKNEQRNRLMEARASMKQRLRDYTASQSFKELSGSQQAEWWCGSSRNLVGGLSEEYADGHLVKRLGEEAEFSRLPAAGSVAGPAGRADAFAWGGVTPLS